MNLHAGVEVSPGVFKDVPAELHRREEYVYAHTPTGTPGGEVGQAQRSTHCSGANNTCSCSRLLATCAALDVFVLEGCPGGEELV